MILNRLSVAHWRSLVEATEVGPFDEGLNVVHAPNGTGKSSLFEALRRALFDHHGVTGKEIEAVRPWGRDLVPRVAVEFTQSGVRYRMEKTFLESPGAHLSRWEDGRFQPLAEGRAADARVREILGAAEVPGRGVSRSEHWGWAQVLWAPQGALGLEEISKGVTDRIRVALGVQLVGEGGTRLEALLEEEFLRCYTPAGKLRSGKDAPPLEGMRKQREALVQERQRLQAQQLGYEEAARTVEDARHRRAQARREWEALKEPLLRARQLAETFDRLKVELDLKRQAEQGARERHETIGRALEWILATRSELGEIATRIEKEEARWVELSAELSLGRELVAQRRAVRDEARLRRDSLSVRQREVEEARAFLEESRLAQALGGRVEKVRALAAEIAGEKERRAGWLAPDDRILREVRKQIGMHEKAEARLQASMVRLTLRPIGSVKVRSRAEEAARQLAAGEEVTFTGSPEVRLEIEGFGRVHAVGPESGVDLEALRVEVAEAKSAVARLCQPYGSADPDRLELMREKAREMDRRIDVLEGQMREVLGEETLEGLQAQRAEVEARLAERVGRYPAWAAEPPVLSAMQAEAEAQQQLIGQKVGQSEDAFEQAQAGATAIEKRQAEAELGLRNARIHREKAQARLVDLTRDGLSDEARQVARREALMGWEAARHHLAEGERQLAAIGEDPRKWLEKLERQAKALEETESHARDAENKAEGRLQSLSAQGAYSQLAACEESLADLDQRIGREQRRLDALKLLHDTVHQCRKEAVAAVAAPVERVASRMLERVAGPRLGTLKMTEGFVPDGVQPNTLGEPVALDHLSGGEQEQLHLVTRLALGQVLAREERQLVVLDDVLNATDSGRLGRLLVVLEEASERLQVVILTCHPERYRGLDRARFFELIPGTRGTSPG